jgi:signal transduction histidine kinase
VRDDGLGLQQGRPDSHGLEIMRERALLIGATLTITDGPGSGTVVTVRTAGESGGASGPTVSGDAIVTA